MEACVGGQWGAIATGVQDAPSCVRGCQDSLRRLLAPNNGTDENFCRALVQLGQARRAEMMLGLYCCDSQLCGVDNIGLPGFDPNVDFLINVCKGQGFPLIQDPGPPSSTFTCINTLLPNSDISCSRTTISTTQTTPFQIMPPIQTTSSITTIPGSSNRVTVEPSISSIVDPKLGQSLNDGSKDDGSNGLSAAAKIVIATTVGVALLMALIAVLWHWRYRQKNKMSEQVDEPQSALAMVPPQKALLGPRLESPPASLGLDGEPLTPPLRLKERRLLPGASTERLIESRSSNLRPGFHLPTSSIAGPGSVYGSAGGSAHVTTGAAAARPSTESRPPGAALPTRGWSLCLSPLPSQFSSIPYDTTLAGAGPPPTRGPSNAPTSVTRSSHSRGRSQTEVSPAAIGMALEFPPPQDDNLSRQASQTSRGSSEIMTGPLAGGWRDSVTLPEVGSASLDGFLAASTPRSIKGHSRSPILEERDLEEMAGSYRPRRIKNGK